MNQCLRDTLMMVNENTFTWEDHELDYIIKKIIREFLSKSLDEIVIWCQEKNFTTRDMMNIKEFIQFLMEGED